MYRERVAMQRRLDGLFPRGMSLEVVDRVTIPGTPLQTGLLGPCGRVFCAEVVFRTGDEPDLYLLLFDKTERLDPDPWIGYGTRPWQAWTDGEITGARAQTYRDNTYRFTVLDGDGEDYGWTAYMDADPPSEGPGPRVVRPRYRQLATERWEEYLFPRGLDLEALAEVSDA